MSVMPGLPRHPQLPDIASFLFQAGTLKCAFIPRGGELTGVGNNIMSEIHCFFFQVGAGHDKDQHRLF